MNSARLAMKALLALILSSAQMAYAETTLPQVSSSDSAPVKPLTKPCVAAEHRQFEFWIGDWEVTTPDGKPADTNLIESIFGGCVLHENWRGRGGSSGQSFNVYDAKRKVWHQTWVDGQGGLLILEGSCAKSTMTLSDKGMPGKTDVNVINEISWTTLADGAMHQLWRTTANGGKSWSVAFDGKYVRSSRMQPTSTAN